MSCFCSSLCLPVLSVFSLFKHHVSLYHSVLPYSHCNSPHPVRPENPFVRHTLTVIFLQFLAQFSSPKWQLNQQQLPAPGKSSSGACVSGSSSKHLPSFSSHQTHPGLHPLQHNTELQISCRQRHMWAVFVHVSLSSDLTHVKLWFSPFSVTFKREDNSEHARMITYYTFSHIQNCIWKHKGVNWK